MRRIAVAATAPFGADVLERLAARHDVALLLTRPDTPRGRGRKLAAPPAKETAERLGIPIAQPVRLDDAVELGADTVVVCAYGLIVPEPLLDRALWLNVHPSLLPRWRGAAPVERALMAGDARTGVTIHRTIAELDAGPIAAQRAFDVGPDDDAGTVYARSAEVAAGLLDGVLAEDEPAFTPQPAEGVTYAEKIRPEDRELDLSRPARELVDRVRALSPHIGARAVVDGRPLIVWKARAAPDGSLELLKVQPEGRRRMTYDEYLRGRRG
jgi:methionyl-tRNA formyltransferase